MALEINEIKLKLCSYCAYQERSVLEAKNKINEFDLDEYATEELLKYLNTEGFLNDERFATTFAGSKFRQKKWGKNKIRLSLLQKGIDTLLCESAIAEINDEDYFAAMLTLLQKKATLLDEPDIYKFRLKLYNFVKSKGYDNDMIWKGIREIESNQ